MTAKTKILLIEDNSEMRENIAEILELSGYTVFTAEDGLKGIQAARQHQPDLILSDIMMPNLDGLGMLKIINQDEHLKDIPVIFLTAKAEKDDFRKGMNLGAEDYLVKPFEAADLLAVVEKKVDKYKKLSRLSLGKSLAGLLDLHTIQNFPQVKQLLDLTESKVLGKKTKIWNTGDHVNFIYFLEGGISKEVIESVGDKELILNFYLGPCVVGLNRIFQTKYSSVLELLEECAIKSIPKKLIEEIIVKENLLYAYQAYCTSYSQEYVHRLSINSFGNVREKVAYHLVLLSGLFKDRAIALSRDDLASFCGMAKETLIRMLTEFKEEKLIQLDSDGILLLQVQKLNALFI